MTGYFRWLSGCVAGALLAAGCQTYETATPAVLAVADDDAMKSLKSVLAEAVGRANIELGPGDLTTSSTLSVLPRRLSPDVDRSPATPTYFDIMQKGERCYLVRRDTGDEYPLDGVACRAAP